MKKIILFSVLAILLLASAVSAHQPRLISSVGMVNKITDPEISQAFYSTLEGQEAVYQIDSAQPFKFYVGLLAPDLPGIEKNLTATVYQKNQSDWELIATLDGTKFSWTQFYEEFAGDNYWQGPEWRENALAGSYQIRISNPNNTGKYVLAVGETESFPPSTFLSTVGSIGLLKINFFNKTIWSIFEGKIIRYLTIGLVILVVIIVLVVVLIVRKVKRAKVN